MLAHPLDPAPGRLVVVRDGEALDNRGGPQVRRNRFRSVDTARPRLEMQRSVMGEFADTRPHKDKRLPPSVGNATQGQCVPGTWKKRRSRRAVAC
jgi:hypothetical protein